MKRRTTTAQINAALPMMDVVKVEYYNKDTYTTTAIDTEIFTENLQFLAECGALTDCMGWNFEKNPDADREYIFETGRRNSESDAIVTAWMRLKDDVNSDDLEDLLMLRNVDD